MLNFVCDNSLPKIHHVVSCVRILYINMSNWSIQAKRPTLAVHFSYPQVRTATNRSHLYAVIYVLRQGAPLDIARP